MEEEKQGNLQYCIFLYWICNLCYLPHGIRFNFILAFPSILLCRSWLTSILKSHLWVVTSYFDISPLAHLPPGTLSVIPHSIITLQQLLSRWLVPLNYSLSFFPTSSGMSLCVANWEDSFLCFVSQWKYLRLSGGDYARKEVILAPSPLATYRAGSSCPPWMFTLTLALILWETAKMLK